MVIAADEEQVIDKSCWQSAAAEAVSL